MASDELLRELRSLFREMEERYDAAAADYGFGCAGCEENCCTIGFKHYTHLEHELLKAGLEELPEERRTELRDRSRAALSDPAGERAPCPLLDGGRCSLYAHRLMICRMHGVPYSMTNPRQGQIEGDGCLRFRRLHEEPYVVRIDRTTLYRRFAELERQALEEAHLATRPRPRSIPEMILEIEADRA